jgi:signal transduction histidine kinase
MTGPELVDRRGRGRDLLAVFLPLTAGLVMLVGVRDVGPAPLLPTGVEMAAGTAGCLALFWRHRVPVTLTLALTALGVVSVTGGFAGPVALFTVAVRRRAITAIVTGVVALAAVPAAHLVPDAPPVPLWPDVAFAVGLNGGVIGWGMFVRARRQLVQSLRERADRAEAEQHVRAEQARRAERTRIAREMHDVLAHRISLVSLHAGALEVRTDARPEEVATAAGVIRANAHQALQELRQVIGVLHEGDVGCDAPDPTAHAGTHADADAPPERPQPGLDDLGGLIASARDAGTRVTYTTTVKASPVPAGLGRAVYRLVQEGLTNARKHAPGTPVDVLVSGRRGHELRVRVSNPMPLPGRRSDVPGARVGLVGLGERVSLAGGRLEHGADPGTGTFRLEAWLPWTP